MTTLTDAERRGLLELAYSYAFPQDDSDPRPEWSVLESYVERIMAEAVDRERASIARRLRSEAHGRNDAAFNRVLIFAAGCVLARYDRNDAHSYCSNRETCPRCSLLRGRDEEPVNASGPDLGLTSMCARCGRGLVSAGEWCCGDFTP